MFFDKRLRDTRLGFTTLTPFTVMAEEHPPSPVREDDTPFAREIAGQARNDGLRLCLVYYRSIVP